MKYIVVRCYECGAYQGNALRKDRKFRCKVCGRGQSVRKIIAESDLASDIRPVVQQLNLEREEKRDKEPDEGEMEEDDEAAEQEETSHSSKKSRWEKFMSSGERGDHHPSDEEHSSLQHREAVDVPPEVMGREAESESESKGNGKDEPSHQVQDEGSGLNASKKVPESEGNEKDNPSPQVQDEGSVLNASIMFRQDMHSKHVQDGKGAVVDFDEDLWE